MTQNELDVAEALAREHSRHICGKHDYRLSDCCTCGRDAEVMRFAKHISELERRLEDVDTKLTGAWECLGDQCVHEERDDCQEAANRDLWSGETLATTGGKQDAR